jgi:hypothetical protein
MFSEVCGLFAYTNRPHTSEKLTYASFLAELKIAFTVVPQTTHWPFKAGLPFFIVTR